MSGAAAGAAAAAAAATTTTTTSLSLTGLSGCGGSNGIRGGFIVVFGAVCVQVVIFGWYVVVIFEWVVGVFCWVCVSVDVLAGRLVGLYSRIMI